MIVILTNQRDFSADAVIAQLSSFDQRILRINTEDLHLAQDWSPAKEIEDVSAVWWRQFAASNEPAASIAELDELLVVTEQWRSWISVLDAPGVYWVNSIWAARAAENKVNQLRAARDAGLSVPKTLVTNNSMSATSFQAAVGPCVIKTLRAGYFAHSDQAFAFTRSLTSSILELESDWIVQPMIVQQRVDPRLDIRVFVVRDRVVAAVAAQAPSDSDDWRLNSDSVDWRPIPVSEELAAGAVRYAHLLGLEYCAMDFAQDSSTTWFLEGNQAGEFAFVDRPLKLGISRALAEALATGSR